ncbi:uncharacterized protein LOC106181833 [Lingula anatina]|uniref:Uncharacterized protein LOC106181833 n=1 Tax=Lingula anatina TaxID=7574 RepID=A0A1S3KH43_LINAN|nr:uncharacterized protein LOC106181833 [Lingula anatina]|eukprot:XP_013421789.1 uncharacterized protein LOC106181833 [Lingula anatina]
MGGGISQLSEEQIKELTEQTPFNAKELAKLLKRYSHYDNSEKGDLGVSLEELLKIPELIGYSLIPAVAQLFVLDSGRIYPEQFIYMFSVLNSRTTVEKKRDLAFKLADTNKQGVLNKSDVIGFLGLLYAGALSAKEVEYLAEKILQREDLDEQGQLSRTDFDKFVSDAELKEQLTVDLQLQ